MSEANMKTKMCKSPEKAGNADLQRNGKKNMITAKDTVFGALKLIEALCRDGEIPEHVFRNILNEYGDDLSLEDFRSFTN